MSTIEYNLVFVKSPPNRLLLGLKQRGFATNKWMGYGGKMEIGETIYEAAQRELQEESNLFVELSDLIYLGKTTNYRQNQVHIVHIFTTIKVNGELKATDEMIPKWFDYNHLPYDQMLDDCKYWYDLMWHNKKFDAQFWFDDDDHLIGTFVMSYNPTRKLESFTMMISDDDMNECLGIESEDIPITR